MLQDRNVVYILAILAGISLSWVYLFHPLTVDDAYIGFRFAHNAFNGFGLVWNPGEPPVEGMTSLLWTVLLIPFAGNKDLVYLVAKGLGLITLLAAYLVVLRTAWLHFGRRSMLVSATFLAAAPVFVFHALNGLETGLVFLFSALFSSKALGLVNIKNDQAGFGRKAITYSIIWLLAGIARPELVVYGGLLAFFMLKQLTSPLRRMFITRVSYFFVIPGLIYFISRYLYFDHMLPLPFYAKRSDAGFLSFMGAGYAVLTFLGLYLGVLISGLYSCVNGHTSQIRQKQIMLIFPAVIMPIFYVLFDPVMGFVYRFTAPYLIPLVLAGSCVLADGTTGRVNTKILSVRFGIVLFAVLHLAASVVPAYHWSHFNSYGTVTFHKAFGKLLATMPAPGTIFAMNDFGGPAFFSDWHSKDATGLVTPEMSVQRAGKREMILSYKPDVVIDSGCNFEKTAIAKGRFGFYLQELNYILLKKLPFLVTKDGSIGVYQCIFSRQDYPLLHELQRRLSAMNPAPQETPWYFALYRKLKATFSQ